MDREGPLANPRLVAVEAALESGRLDEAQHLLAELGGADELGAGTSFLATRLLYLRGRLDGKGLAQRLRDLLRDAAPFPEAQALLALAEAGALVPPELPAPKSSSSHPAPTPKPRAGEGQASQHPTSSLPPPLPVTSALGSLALPNAPRISERPGWPLSLKTPQIPGILEHRLAAPKGAKLASSLELPPPESAPGLAEPLDITDAGPVMIEVSATESSGIESDAPFEGLADSLEPPEPDATDVDSGWSNPSAEASPAELPSPARDHKLGAGSAGKGSTRQLPSIPRAPAIPKFAPPADFAPSYVPPGRLLDSPSHTPWTPRSLGGASGLGASGLGASGLGGTSGLGGPEQAVTLRGAGDVREGIERAGGAAGPPDHTALVVESRPEALTRPLPSMAKLPGAGRYSGCPATAEIVWSRVGGPESRREPAATVERARPHANGSIARVASDPAEPPTLFEVASLLDEGRFDAAIRVLELTRPSPEQQLLRARALSGAGRPDEATECVAALCATQGLDPELRAGAARLLLELEELDLALRQARLALAEAPETPLVRLTLAWSALRLARRGERAELVMEASRALEGLRSRGGPHPALVLALRACVHAHDGEHERAMAVAQRALSLDPRGVDALAAIAIARARLGDSIEAERALAQLREGSAAEADALARFLQGGRARPSPGAPTPAFIGSADARMLWDRSELDLLEGAAEPALGAFERLCRERLSDLAGHEPDPSFMALGELAAAVLAHAPVFVHFAPYDFTTESLARVSAALDVLYDPAQLPRPEADEFPALLLVGAYIGQLLCDHHDGEWHGTVLDLPAVTLDLRGSALHPFRQVAARIRQGTALELTVGARASGRDLWPHRSPSIVPPTPWGSTWPEPELLPRLGRALAHSVPSRWCERHAGGPLDGSIESIAALDRYFDLVAPPGRQPASVVGWAPRVAVLVGAYLGEVLRTTLGGAWLPPRAAAALGPDSYRLRVSDTEITPVAKAYARASGRGASPLGDYASRFMR